MRAMSAVEMAEYASTVGIPRSLSEDFTDLPSHSLVRYLRAEDKHHQVLQRQSVEFRVSGKGTTWHMFSDCSSLLPKSNQRHHYVRSTYVDFVRMEAGTCKSCLKRAETDTNGANLLAWARLASMYSLVRSANNLLDQIAKKEKPSSSDAVRAATSATAIRSLLERMSGIDAKTLASVTSEVESLLPLLDSASEDDSRDHAIKLSSLIAAVTCGTEKRTIEFCGAPTAPAFMHYEGYRAQSAGAVALVQATNGYRVTGSLIDESFLETRMRAQLDNMFNSGPTDWRQVPQTLAFAAPSTDQSVSEWMLANWQAEFSATADAYIEYVTQHVNEAMTAPALPLKVTLKVAYGAGDVNVRAVRDLLTAFSPSESVDGKVIEAVVPAIVAGAALSYQPGLGNGVTLKVTPLAPAHAELVSTALSLFTPNTNTSLTQLPMAFQLAIDALGVDILPLLTALPALYHRYPGVVGHVGVTASAKEQELVTTLF